MNTIHEKVLGPAVIREDSALYGMITESATVAQGVHFEISGMVAGDLEIEPGADVEVHGMVTGSIVNRGRLRVNGMVIGSITDMEGGQTQRAPGSSG